LKTFDFTEVYLAEDDEDDRALFREALKIVVPEARLTIANNGMDLMQRLMTNKPDIIFLDINMPLKNGIDCIQWIRDLRDLRKLLVVAYSSAFNRDEINKAYAFGVHLYLIKPTKLKFLVEDLEHLFQLQWNDPNRITSDHFINGSYVPFNGKRGEPSGSIFHTAE
jgi:CheY-like chemotaxis protein